ncbi:MAG TPA: hypothetical protein VHS31_16505 [Tepidisphaeraceae bacterium]|jgi:hypothetical protein|nr:hypothetical protein [Tepidisphaeraceae bacterium]
MAEARVDSIDALKSLKAAMLKFAEGANVALGDAESEIMRTVTWLENEQTSYWQLQERKRMEMVGRCKEALRAKRLFKDSSGRTPSAVEEEKALRVALRRMEEAAQKLAAVKKAKIKLEKEIPLYRASVQRFATDVQVDVPMGVELLETLLVSLDAYTSPGAPDEVVSSAPSAAGIVSGGEVGQSMARAVDGDEDEEKPKEEIKE